MRTIFTTLLLCLPLAAQSIPQIVVQQATRASCEQFQQTMIDASHNTGLPPLPWGGCKQNVIVVASGVIGATGYQITIQYVGPDGKAASKTAYVAVNELGQGVKMFEDGMDDIKLTRVIAIAQRSDVAGSVEIH